MRDLIAGIRKRVRQPETQSAPPPWRALPTFAVGGLAAVGFSYDSAALLAASAGGGRSLYDTQTGDQIARDRTTDVNAWLSADGTEATGIGPLEGETINVAGLWGGTLSPLTKDGWSCSVDVHGPIERVMLRPPSRANRQGIQIAKAEVVEMRAAGFSPDGTILVVATTADVTMWIR